MRTLLKIVCALALMVYLRIPAFSQERINIACTPDKPVVYSGETITLKVWADSEKPNTCSYDWELAAGKLLGKGREVTWDFSGLRPGTYTATVHVGFPTGETEKCSIEVLVQDPEARGGATGWSLLISGRREKPGYGLYSYILFGSRPTASRYEVFLKTIEAYVALVEPIVSLEKAGIAPHRLNITYLPVTKMPPTKSPTSKWLLDNYDFALARRILSAMPGEYRSEGPYIISHLNPLTGVSRFPEKYLYQDLSIIEPDVVFNYAKEFFNQAAQERYWEERTLRNLALKLQNIIHILALGLPEVRGAMKDTKDVVKMVE